MRWEAELEAAKEAALAAGAEIQAIYERSGAAETTYKADRSPLTLADRAANECIVRRLRTRFPSYAILSEEEKDDASRLENPYCFIVDPLDGTKEFLKRNGQFTVNIALAYAGESVVGVVYAPAQGKLYFAARGLGAYRTDEVGTRRISVSERTERLRAAASLSHDCAELQAFLARNAGRIEVVTRLGSSLKGCLVAEGGAEIYYRHNPTMEWDTAAMQCVVEEAGGLFRQMDGSALRYNRADPRNAKGFYAVNCAENVLR